MMGRIMIWLFVGLILAASPGARSQDFSNVDNTLLLYPEQFERPEDLARLIARDFKEDRDKVRAIYGWIISHVSYDPTQYQEFDFSFRNFRERNKKEVKKREAIILRTIQKGKAVCEGYAMLFERLCELLGINNYLVRGQSKARIQDIGSEFQLNHLWNIAYVDGEPLLFDTTWGAGRFTDRFVADPDYFYFMAAPDMLIRSHYPEMPEDSLLPDRITAEQFSELPLFLDQNLRMSDLISPGSGLIKAQQNRGLVNFQVMASQIKKLAYSFGDQQFELTFRKVGQILYFQVPLPEDPPEYLIIYFDGEPALAYRVES